jgi:hypothetical protein
MTQHGVAKFAAVGTEAKTGAPIASSTPQYGHAHKMKHVVLLFFGWNSDDLIPKAQLGPDFE